MGIGSMQLADTSDQSAGCCSHSYEFGESPLGTAVRPGRGPATRFIHAGADRHQEERAAMGPRTQFRNPRGCDGRKRPVPTGYSPGISGLKQHWGGTLMDPADPKIFRRSATRERAHTLRRRHVDGAWAAAYFSYIRTIRFSGRDLLGRPLCNGNGSSPGGVSIGVGPFIAARLF